MKIQTIEINDVAGITQLNLTFDERMNILCGPNGIGKTTILECCAHSFSLGATSVLKSRVSKNGLNPIGTVKAGLTNENMPLSVQFKVSQHDPGKYSEPQGEYQNARFILSLKTGRILSYQALDAVRKDSPKSDHHLYEDIKKGVSSDDIKSWFVNRDLYSTKEKALSIEQMANYKLAIECFSKLNTAFSFSHVSASSLDIYITTPGGMIVHEYLSSGFKSCLVMLLGIIKELEFRFPNEKVEDIEAIVLIDEIELHLHPEWQGKITEVLINVFPKMQFIVTTHSPHVIQSAERNQIIALQANGDVAEQRPLPLSPYGFKGWTIDEVLTDVMGMTDTRSDFFSKLQQNFNDALDSRDKTKASAAYAEIEKSLHPNSVEAKLMRLQMIGTDWDSHDQA
ncbi:AAA family ATPase [Alcaligenes sp. RM2]